MKIYFVVGNATNYIKLRYLLKNQMPSKKILKTCEYCQNEYMGAPKRKFCSLKCSADSSSTKVKCKCKNCQKTIYKIKSKVLTDTFCSNSCYKEYKKINNTKETKQCKYCNKTFTFYPKVQKGVFCSRECHFKYGFPTGKEHKNFKQIEVNCIYCNKLFNRKPSELNNNNVFCSKQCFYDSSHCAGKEFLEYKFIKCTICNKKIRRSTKQISKQKNHYCSNQCFYKADRKGINNSNYKYLLSTKHRENNRLTIGYIEWRKDVLKRDRYICQICGTGNKYNKPLNTHHIENYKNNPKKRTLLNNGITLCKICHIQFHKEYGYKNNTKEQLVQFKINNKKSTSTFLHQL